MKTTCPACGAVASLDVLIGHEGARDAVVCALTLYGPLGPVVVQYLGLFRPAQRNIAMSRVASLLREIKPMISEGKITRNGRIHSAPQDYWIMAINEMLDKRDKLTLPLKNHGYLLAIIEGYSSKAEAKQEAQHENSKAGRTPVGSPRPQAGEGLGVRVEAPKPRAELPQTVKEALSKFKGGNDGQQ